jgi:hypothetical protein
VKTSNLLVLVSWGGDDEYVAANGMFGRRNPKYSERTYPNAGFPIRNPT